VTLLPTLDEEGVKHGINESKVKTIITSQELFSKFEVKKTFYQKQNFFFHHLENNK
jgi:hypothetical protein